MSWSDYMKSYGYREYPCQEHGKPFCKECYGPDPLDLGVEKDVVFKEIPADEAEI